MRHGTPDRSPGHIEVHQKGLNLTTASTINMVYIDCHGSYCSVTRKGPDGMQQIVLSRIEWLKLCKLSPKVSEYMECTSEESRRKEEQLWTLTPERSIGSVSGQPWKKVVTKLTLNCYKGSPYCNIRVYVGDGPSKQGVTLNVVEWFSVHNRLSNVPGSEVHLSEKAYRKLLIEAIAQAISDRCVGCKESWPSQTDHECIVGRASLIQRLGEHPDGIGVSIFTFQHELMLLAKDHHVMLETSPSDLLDVCDNLLRPEIVDTICKEDAILHHEMLLVAAESQEDIKQSPQPSRVIKEWGKRANCPNRHSPYP